MFGDGEICQCNPIAETDLAEYMINCIEDESKWNKVLDLGGPDEGMTMKQQGEMIFSVTSVFNEEGYFFSPSSSSLHLALFALALTYSRAVSLSL